MSDLYKKVCEYHGKEPGLVLATVVSISGSSPQKPGSSALFSKEKLLSGTIGGGVTEGRVSLLAKERSASGVSGLVTYKLGNDISEKDEAICGGEITILIDARPGNHISVFNEAALSIARGLPGVLLTMVTRLAADNCLINRYWISSAIKPSISKYFNDSILPVANNMIASGNSKEFKSLTLSIPGDEPESKFFLESLFPLPELIIAGAGHIGKALAHIGKNIGFRVTVIDDRPEYANSINIPDADNHIVGNIGEVIQNLIKGSNTYFVIVTRGHKDDAEALKSCIGSEAAYIGMIGSRAKVAKMKEEFISQKWASLSEWGKIYTPIGIDIGSVTVEEIAISIAAQLIKVKNS